MSIPAVDWVMLFDSQIAFKVPLGLSPQSATIADWDLVPSAREVLLSDLLHALAAPDIGDGLVIYVSEQNRIFRVHAAESNVSVGVDAERAPQGDAGDIVDGFFIAELHNFNCVGPVVGLLDGDLVFRIE